MEIDEVEALRRAFDEARSRNWEWRDHFWIVPEGRNWRVQAESDAHVFVDRSTGNIVSVEQPGIDAIAAFAVAREYAANKGLSWKPAFHLTREDCGWRVGACQSQFGGQLYIHVADSGLVTKHHINSK